MCRKNHTKVGTWQGESGGSDNWISRTITGLMIGKPVIFGAYSPTTGTNWRIGYRVTAGCDVGNITTNGYSFGNRSERDDSGPGNLTVALIPNATSMTMRLWDFDADEYIYIYQ